MPSSMEHQPGHDKIADLDFESFLRSTTASTTLTASSFISKLEADRTAKDKKKRRATMAPATEVVADGLLRPLAGPMSVPQGAKTRGVVGAKVSKKYLSPGDTRASAVKYGMVLCYSQGRNAAQDSVDYKRDEVKLPDDEGCGIEHDGTEYCRVEVDETAGDGFGPAAKNINAALADKLARKRAAAPTEQITTSVTTTPKPRVKVKPKTPKSPKVADKKISEDDIDKEEEELEAKDQRVLAAEIASQALVTFEQAMKANEHVFQELRDENWHPDEIRLFQRLSMRGFEPIMHNSWAHVFRTCPSILFTGEEDKTYLNTISHDDFRATKALESLTSLGARIRALRTVKRRTELTMKKEIENYIKWSDRDGGYRNKPFIPLVTVVAGNGLRNKDLDAPVAEVTEQLQYLAAEHRKACRVPATPEDAESGSKVVYRTPPPVVFGFICLKTSAVIVSLDSIHEDGREPHTITAFDFSNTDMDVWNGIAIAMVVVTVRNMVLEQTKDLESETEEEDDTDV